LIARLIDVELCSLTVCRRCRSPAGHASVDATARPSVEAGKINAAAQGLELLRRRVGHLSRVLESLSGWRDRRSTDSERRCWQLKRAVLENRDAMVKSV
jgi:hypothetical protein